LFKRKKKNINVVRLSGIISSNSRNGLNLKNCKSHIDKAFLEESSSSKKSKKHNNLSAVVFIINSPGGSPVQSEMISNYIISKSLKYGVKVITFVEEVGASGGYWLSLVGSEIYALSSSSIVGSLGVVSASFGLDKFIEKHNVTRRVYTAGENKVMLDAFQEEKAEDINRLKELLSLVHLNFKNWVLNRRDKKITLNHNELFSGLYWLAPKALEHGLIDGIAFDLTSKLQELFGDDIKINYIENKVGLIKGLFYKSELAQSLVDESVAKLKSELMWNKFGL
jgi:ClpP class serine protease